MSKSSKISRVAKNPIPKVTRWINALNALALRQRLSLSDDDIAITAGLICCVPEAKQTQAYWAISGLLYRPRFRGKGKTSGKVSIRSALDCIPPKVEQILVLSACVQSYSNITGRSLTKEKFRAEQVIPVMLEIPHPSSYIRYFHKKDMTPFGVMFHPNTLANAKRTLRGIFGGTTGPSDSYWERTKESLEILE